MKSAIRKLKIAEYVSEDEEQIEAATDLVSRELKNKKAVNAATLQKIQELAKKIEVPASSIAREDVGTDAQEVIKAAEVEQELVATEASSLLMVVVEEVQKENVDCSEVGVSKAARGNPDFQHNANVIVVESSSTTSSQSTSSSDIDNIPLNRVYENLHKALSPSSSTKLQKKPNDDTFEPMHPSVQERIHDMAQMGFKVCERLPANHPFQPPMVKPLQSIIVDAEVIGEHVGPKSANRNVSSSSHPTSTTHTSEPSVLENLVSHYSGELPGVEPNQEKASEVAYSEVALESPQQQSPNVQMTSTTCPDVSAPKHVAPEHSGSRQLVPFHIESHPSLEKVSEPDQPLETNTSTATSTNDALPSNLAIQPCASAKTNVPSSPTLFLDSTIFADVCENIFKELNKLI